MERFAILGRRGGREIDVSFLGVKGGICGGLWAWRADDLGLAAHEARYGFTERVFRLVMGMITRLVYV